MNDAPAPDFPAPPRAWALRVAERCGRKRVTLREDRCLAEREAACEYTVSWVDPTYVPSIAIGALITLVGLLAASSRGTIPPAAWMLLPVAAAVARLVERRLAARGNVAAEAEASAGFRWLVERALAASRQAVAVAETR